MHLLMRLRGQTYVSTLQSDKRRGHKRRGQLQPHRRAARRTSMKKHILIMAVLVGGLAACTPGQEQRESVPAGENPEQLIGDGDNPRPDPATVGAAERNVDSQGAPNSGITTTPADTTADTTGT